MDANKIVEKMSVSDWLKGSDIAGQEVPVTVESVEEKTQTRDGVEIPQLVLHFVEEVKQVGLNMGNANIMIGLFGGDTDDWVGKSITLYTVMANKPGGGGQVPGIRVKSSTANPSASTVGAPTDEPPIQEAPPEDSEPY